MFGRRRRPLLRAAAVGGAGYAVGKRRANVQGEDDAAVEGDDAAVEGEDEAAPRADDSGLKDDSIDALERIGDLKERGLLTQQEFDEQKARILGTS
jgi:hypothetical protein